MSITVNITELKKALLRCFKVGLVPYVQSSPGSSKSALARQIANERKLLLIDIRLSLKDPIELLGGFPKVDKEFAYYVPFNTFPTEKTPIPEGYKGWLILFDEFSSALLSTQAAAYQIVLDRVIGQHKLHPKVWIMCAGNLASDKAVVNRLSTAMQSRLIHLHLKVENQEWLDWGISANIDYRILSYIEFKPSSLYSFNPNHDDMTFPCLRTWEFVSNLIKGCTFKDDKGNVLTEYLPLICGAIGEAEGRQFYGYCQIFNDLPTINDILSKPETTHIPTEPSTLYAISGLLTEHLKESNADVLLKYISRLPIEFGVITLRNIIKRYPDSITYPSIKEWRKTYSKELFL